MAYYHCSPTVGLTVLEPRKTAPLEKPARVYMTTLLPKALMYTVRNYEYSYGYTKEGQEKLKAAATLLCQWLNLKNENARIYVEAAIPQLSMWIGESVRNGNLVNIFL